MSPARSIRGASRHKSRKRKAGRSASFDPNARRGAGLAQLVEQRFCKPKVAGSNPASGTSLPRPKFGQQTAVPTAISSRWNSRPANRCKAETMGSGLGWLSGANIFSIQKPNPLIIQGIAAGGLHQLGGGRSGHGDIGERSSPPRIHRSPSARRRASRAPSRRLHRAPARGRRRRRRRDRQLCSTRSSPSTSR